MNRPITSYPCAFSKHAATELSTPPLIASTTRCAMEPRFNPPPAVKPGEISGPRTGARRPGSLPEYSMAEDQPATSRSGIPAGLFHLGPVVDGVGLMRTGEGRHGLPISDSARSARLGLDLVKIDERRRFLSSSITSDASTGYGL